MMIKKVMILLLMNPLALLADIHLVDNQGDCAGMPACYSSIQQALNNALPGDEIHVFPGSYLESVDLSMMGSELGPVTEGNISFTAVDANNFPTPGLAHITPATGSAFIHSGSFFVGDVVINGFVVSSIDDDGIDLDLIEGDITIQNVNASGNDRDGIDVQVSTGGHTIRIINSITNSNLSSGLNLDGPDGTQIEVFNAQANNNIGDGINITSITDGDVLNVSIFDSVTLDNGVDKEDDSAGVVVYSEGTLSVKNLVSKTNHGPGLEIIDLTSTSVIDSTFENNAVIERFSGIFLVSAGEFNVARSVFSGNGDSGINVYKTNVIGNELTSFTVNCSTFNSNSIGIHLNNSIVNTADFNITNNNFIGQGVAAIHAGVDNDVIDANDNWWSDASGPTHSSNPVGTGDRLSDSVDDAIGSAEGIVEFSSISNAEISFNQNSSDTVFSHGFESGFCNQL